MEAPLRGKTLIFSGVIQPERENVYFDSVLNYFDARYDLNISVKSSSLSVICRIKDFSENLPTLKNYVSEHVEAAVDIIGLQECAAFNVEIRTVTFLDDGDSVVFDTREPLFEEGEDMPALPNQPLHLAGDHSLAFALSDFREAINKPHRTLAYCRRAMEAIANSFSDDKKEKWILCQQALNFREVTLLKHSDDAHEIRHGRQVSQSWTVRKEAMLIARELIRRYMYFIRNERIALDETEFPKF